MGHVGIPCDATDADLALVCIHGDLLLRRLLCRLPCSPGPLVCWFPVRDLGVSWSVLSVLAEAWESGCVDGWLWTMP